MIILTAAREFQWKAGGGKSETFNAPAGTVLFFPPQCEVQVKWPARNEHLLVTLERKLITDIFEIEDAHEVATLFPAPSRYVNPRIMQVVDLLRPELISITPVMKAYLCALRTVLVTVLIKDHTTLREHPPNSPAKGLSDQAAHKIEDYLRANFGQKISIPEMAAVLGISTGHFLPSFRRTFGQTPHQYLLMLRLDEAERCLRETDLSLQEIARRSGFSSQNHMTTVLRKNRFTTPGMIRRMRAGPPMATRIIA
ncbi:AraC family transcriptional regulator [Phyllobacterium phragmitis]|uniref:AraC family transcriptional regulator n=2 Tax=Phyllobacterium phragmitis TaxID=2670329 RepID=A0A2S9IJJ4_9HYPH|nr:AraC family transcriptional regulator [Phyllobacterium phragmitis]